MGIFKRKRQHKHSHPIYVVYQEEMNGHYTLVEHMVQSKKEYSNLKEEPTVTILGEFNNREHALERLNILYNTAHYKDYTYDYAKTLSLN